MRAFVISAVVLLVGCGVTSPPASPEPKRLNAMGGVVEYLDDAGRNVLPIYDTDAGYDPNYCVGNPDNVFCTHPEYPIVTTPCYWGSAGRPGDDRICQVEACLAADAGPGCYVIGTHGDPNGNVDCLPPPNTVPPGTTSCVLSICYGGSNGSAQCVAIQQGLEPDQVIGCTGVVVVALNPPHGLQCNGTWVDGNGNALDPCALSWQLGISMGCPTNDGGVSAPPGFPFEPDATDGGVSDAGFGAPNGGEY